MSVHGKVAWTPISPFKGLFVTLAKLEMAKKARKRGSPGGPVLPVKKKKTETKKNLADQTLEDFLQDWQEDKESNEGSSEEEEEASEEEVEEVGKEGADEEKANRDYVSKLAEKDPEFYKFLQDNDKELLANLSDSDSDEGGGGGGGGGESDDGEEEEDALHRPPESLEVASDESDFDLEDGDDDGDDKGEPKTKKKGDRDRRLLRKKDLQALEKRLVETPNVNSVGELSQVSPPPPPTTRSDKTIADL